MAGDPPASCDGRTTADKSPPGRIAKETTGPCRGLHPLRGPSSLAEGKDMADELKDAIEKNAQGPRSARGDVGEVRQHPLKDQIDADRYLASREARAKPHKALRFAKLWPTSTPHPDVWPWVMGLEHPRYQVRSTRRMR